MRITLKDFLDFQEKVLFRGKAQVLKEEFEKNSFYCFINTPLIATLNWTEFNIADENDLPKLP